MTLLERLDLAIGVRAYIQAKDIRYIDSECGHTEDCWIAYHETERGTAGYISRADAAKLIFG